MKILTTKIFAILCFAGFFYGAHAQIKTKTFANGIPKHLISSESLVTKTMILHPSPEFYKLKLEDGNKKEIASKAALARIALPEGADIDFFKEAALTDNDGILTYALIIKAQDVLNLSIRFKEFFLSGKAVLSIYNHYELTDSITAKDNNENKTLSTRTYSDATLNIVLRVPVSEKDQSILKIGTVYFGYKKLGRFGSPGAADACNINVACPLGVGWEAERNSVAIIKTANGAFGSGVMVMNTCGSDMPYLLTANHGLAAGGTPLSDWLFQFFFYSTDCGTNTGYREDMVFNGATVVSNFSSSDFALLKLLQTPASNSGIFYAGWNRVASPFFFNVTGLHHPRADVMKISRSSTPQPPTSRGAGGSDDPNAHWLVHWSSGITEVGSSGSPLFDQSHRIIGQLHDGTSFCATPNDPDWYGSFDISWTGGGTNTTRLSNWLDPNGTGATTTNTTNISNLLPATLSLSITGGSSTICSGSSTYTLNGAPAGAAIVWSVSNPYIASLSSNNNQVTVTMTGNGTIGLTATVGGNCFTNNVALKTIRLGTYTTSEYNITQYPSSVCLNQTVQFGMPWYYYPPEAGTTYNWTWSGMTYISGQGTNVLTLRAPSSTPFSTPWVIGRANNSCGSGPMSPTKYLVLNTGCWSPYRVSPNPSSDFIKIEVNRDNGMLQTIKTPAIMEVQIIDKMGMVRLKKQISKGVTPITIPVYNLASDIYTLRIFDGQNWYSHKVSVLH